MKSVPLPYQLGVLLRLARIIELIQQNLGLNPLHCSGQVHGLHVGILYFLQLLTKLPGYTTPLVIRLDVLEEYPLVRGHLTLFN